MADHVGRDVFVDALGQSPQASLRLLRLMAARLRSTNRLMGDLALVDLPGRIARQLCESSGGTGRMRSPSATWLPPSASILPACAGRSACWNRPV